MSDVKSDLSDVMRYAKNFIFVKNYPIKVKKEFVIHSLLSLRADEVDDVSIAESLLKNVDDSVLSSICSDICHFDSFCAFVDARELAQAKLA